jgi:hypothetical protein
MGIITTRAASPLQEDMYTVGRITRALTGFYICADYVSGNQWTIGPNGSGGWNVFQQNAAAFPGNIVAFGEAENGTLYAASLSGNQVYRVEQNTVLPLILAGFTGTYRHGTSYLQWHTSMEQNLDYFEIEYSFDGTHYEFAGKVKALNKTEGLLIGMNILSGRKEKFCTVSG